MSRAKLLVLGLGLALIAIFATPAGAQDGPTISVEPASVDAPGEYEFTITGEGWTAAPPIFVLPCTAPESGDIADLDASSDCDSANLTPATPADGAFEVTATLEVGDNGLVIAGGDAAQTESAAFLVTVGAAEEAPAEEAPAEEAPAEEEELANTGVESGLLAIVGIAVLAAGAMVVNTNRRFS